MRERTTKSTLLTAATLALGLTTLIGGPVAAETRSHDASGHQLTDGQTVDTRPVHVAPHPADVPARRDVERPDYEVERLALRCAEADTDRPDRPRVGCEWRAAGSERAAGYQLWRIVDRGERQLVARVGLDTLAVRDVLPSDATVVRYAVLAVDAEGRIVGRSAVERVVLAGGPVDVDRDVRPLVSGWPMAVR